MAVIRNQPTKIKIHRTEEDLQADSVGDVILLYKTTGGVFIDSYSPTELWIIEIFQDTNGKLIGLYVRK